MAEPTTPAAEGTHADMMDDRSDEDTNMEDTTLGPDGESRAEKLAGGRAWIEADGPTDYSLYSNPPSLGLVRQRLFEIEDSIEMSPSDFDTYFPFVDNVWRKNKGGEGENSTISEIYWCRLRKSSNQKPYVPKPTPEGKTSRKKRIREEKTCPMAIKVVRREDTIRNCVVSRAVGPDVRHTHDLDYMDNIKRNRGIMDIARKEAIKGFLPGSVFWKMQEEPDKMDEAGGKFMKISDVRNVQYAWRQDNSTAVLKAHRGYSQTGRGPKPKSAETSVAPPQLPTLPPPPMKQEPPIKQHVLPHQQPPRPQLSPSGPPPAPQAEPMPYPETTSRPLLQYPDHAREFLEPYMPNPAHDPRRVKPHVTLTWATSLDARIALMPGLQTAISGPETKAMTHYLRSRHDAIIVGVRTAVSDDPSLDCRLDPGRYAPHQIRPVIIDPHAQLHIRPDMKVLKAAAEGRGKGPWVVIAPGAKLHPLAVSTLKAYGGEYLMIQDVDPQTGHFTWEALFNVLFKEGIKSIMVEGGGHVLSELLKPMNSDWIDSVVMTIAPTFFGRAGVQVSPEATFDQQRRPIATRLSKVRWQPMGDSDVVMCGQMTHNGPHINGMLPGIAEFSQRHPDHHQQQPPPPPQQQSSQYAPAQNGHQDPPRR